ncbi:hypothetical protein [Clostridium sp.]|uniref:hypothetical protein n=1 Tax=Clostridium sp. TaxID=1506 RepID=UPI00261972DD|nr:hypothetical protein [Clostridium sp.]
MVHEKIKKKIVDTVKLKKNEEVNIYVFGLSYLGKLAIKILKEVNQKEIKLIDNNEKLWNTSFDNVVIHNPRMLLENKNDKMLIFIAVNDEYNFQVVKQLIGYGFKENEDFYILSSYVEPKTMIAELFSEEKKDIFILGDSVMNMVSYSDKDMTILYDMIENELNSKYSFGKFHFRACHLGIFYIVIQYLVAFAKIPSMIVLEINMSNFSPYYYKYQNTKVFNEIYLNLVQNNSFNRHTYGFDKEISEAEYINNVNLYREKLSIKNSYFDYWFKYKAKTRKDVSKKYGYLGTWIYNYKLEKSNRNLLALEEIVKICIKNKIKLVSYITPVNYKQYKKYVGKNFLKYYKINTGIVDDIFMKYSNENIYYVDYSCLLEPKEFIHKNDTVHLNKKGRQKFSIEIIRIINDQMKSYKTIK